MKASEIVNTLETAAAITREGGAGSRRRVSEMLTDLSTQLIREAPQVQPNIRAYYRKGAPSTIYVVDDNNWITYGLETVPLEIAILIWETETHMIAGRERLEGFPLFEFHIPFKSRVELFPETEGGRICICGHQYASHKESCHNEDGEAGCEVCVCGGTWTPREHTQTGYQGDPSVLAEKIRASALAQMSVNPTLWQRDIQPVGGGAPGYYHIFPFTYAGEFRFLVVLYEEKRGQQGRGGGRRWRVYAHWQMLANGKIDALLLQSHFQTSSDIWVGGFGAECDKASGICVSHYA